MYVVILKTQLTFGTTQWKDSPWLTRWKIAELALNNNHSLTLWKESLNSTGQQFHQYQRNEQSSLTEHNKRPQHMALEIQVLAWDRHTLVAGLTGYIESNTGKSARQGNLRHLRVSEISLSCTFCRCLILFLTFISCF